MSGDHNQYQKSKSYLDDFECPRCGHCCQALVDANDTSQERVDEKAKREQEPVVDEGYYCVVCGKYIEAVDGVIVHNDIPHPYMAFDDEENPQ